MAAEEQGKGTGELFGEHVTFEGVGVEGSRGGGSRTECIVWSLWVAKFA